MARDFSAGNQTLTTPYNAKLEPTAPIAIGLWCKDAGSPGSFKYLLSKVVLAGDHVSYGFATDGTGGLRFTVGYDTTSGAFTNSSVIPQASIWDGLWHHVMGVFDGTALSIYLDGAQIGTPVSTPNSTIAYNGSALYLASFDGTQLYFSGQLAEVAMWHVTPTSGDIATLAAGYSPALVRPDKLIAHWPLIGGYHPEIEPVNGFDMTASGTMPQPYPHPRTVRRTRSLWVSPPAGVVPPPPPAGGIWGVSR